MVKEKYSRGVALKRALDIYKADGKRSQFMANMIEQQLYNNTKYKKGGTIKW